MRFQCKYCKKRMEPRVVIEERLTTTNEQTFYCSVCGEQLFVLGGITDRPTWKSFFFYSLVTTVWSAIHGLEIFKTIKKELTRKKYEEPSSKE